MINYKKLEAMYLYSPTGVKLSDEECQAKLIMLFGTAMYTIEYSYITQPWEEFLGMLVAETGTVETKHFDTQWTESAFVLNMCEWILRKQYAIALQNAIIYMSNKSSQFKEQLLISLENA